MVFIMGTNCVLCEVEIIFYIKYAGIAIFKQLKKYFEKQNSISNEENLIIYAPRKIGLCTYTYTTHRRKSRTQNTG